MKLVLDNKTLEKYNQYYFALHPKAKKVPIEKPYHPSINVWFTKKRIEMNALKQKWKDFTVWWVNDLGCQGKLLDRFTMTITIYFPTKARHDLDNQTPKFILDGFIEAGFIVDDDEKHLTSLTFKSGYDKENPRTEIEIEEIKE